MHTLYQANVSKKFYRIWYKLNEKTTIQVKTGAVLSARGLAGPVTGSGGAGAALASAAKGEGGASGEGGALPKRAILAGGGGRGSNASAAKCASEGVAWEPKGSTTGPAGGVRLLAVAGAPVRVQGLSATPWGEGGRPDGGEPMGKGAEGAEGGPKWGGAPSAE